MAGFFQLMVFLAIGYDLVQRINTSSEVNSGCGSCWTREAKRFHDIEVIKTNILKKLRLRRAPNITVPLRPPSVPTIQQFIDNQDMLNDSPWTSLYDSPTELPLNPDDLAEADGMSMMRIVHFSIPENSEPSVLEFRLQRQLGKSDIKSAHIGLYIKHRYSTPWNLSIYSTSSIAGDRYHISTKPLSPATYNTPGQWHRINITRLVEQWTRHPYIRQRVIIEAHPTTFLSNVILHPRGTDNDYSYRPYLEVHIRDQNSAGRSRRTASLNCDEHGIEKRCCRYPLVVDFQSFDWNWIIAPKRYAAFYCSGECPFLYHTTYIHSSVAHRHNEQSSSSSGPCCAPVKTSNISMLYYNEEGNVMLSVLPDMVVDQCGCS